MHHSEALIAAADEVGIRLTLLDACYLAGGFGEPPNAAQERFSDGDAERWARARVGRSRARKVGAAIHSVRAVPAEQLPTVVEWARGQAAALPRLRAARRERGLPRRARRHAGRSCSPSTARSARARPPSTPPTSPTPTASCCSETTICMCPTTERDLADGIGRAGREPVASAATATRSSTSSRRPARSSSTCAWRPSAAATSPRTRCCAARPTTRASAGPRPAGSSPARSPTSSRSAWTPRAWRPPSPRPCSNRSSSPPPRPTSTPS